MTDQHDTRGYRQTWAEIDLDNLSHNLRAVRARIKKGVKVMACVKAEAYGHGLIPVSRELVDAGADFLAVASVDEAVRLRRAGIDSRILVLGLVREEDIPALFDHRITPTVCSFAFAKALSRQAFLRGHGVDIHIKVDTGMGRIGIMHDQAFGPVRRISALPNIRIEGIFTHLACADSDDGLTRRQIRLFGRLVSRLRKASISIPLVHAANSMGIISYPDSHFTMVRPGLILYGLRPVKGLPADIRPVMSLKTCVVYVKDVRAGTGVSYGHTYVTRRATRIATLPVGYGDGYPRSLSNTGPVLINGRRFTIAGRVCMDQVMVDVGDALVRPGDEAVLIGTQKKRRISAESLASLSGTIPYEIVCGINSRVPRVYRKKAALPAEKRRSERRPEAIPVRFFDTPSLADTAGVTGDISAAGMKLYTPDPVLPYRTYRMSLEKRGRDPVRVRGTAVWTRPADNGMYASGIKFLK
ncbi:MAG: alanine racemase [Candidatus Omnitrophica bacterium]|nr:alanine racemase [Candidatus Omnitrophota bacterium]